MTPRRGIAPRRGGRRRKGHGTESRRRVPARVGHAADRAGRQSGIRECGEIPETPRGKGFDTVDGFRTCTPWEPRFDLHGDDALPLGGTRDIRLAVDVFNLFDTKRATEYDNYTEVQFLVPNPDFGRVIAYQSPRQVRLGLRIGR